MDLGTLRALVRNLVLERTGDTGLITDSEANSIINTSQRLLFNRILAGWPEAFAQRSAANVTVASTGIAALTTFASGIVKVLSAEVGAVAAAPGVLVPIPPLKKAKESLAFKRVGTTVTVPARWYVEGGNLVFLPVPSGTFDCRIVYVSAPTDMTNDVDTAWKCGTISMLPELHDTIAILASIIVLTKDSADSSGYKDVFTYIDKVMDGRFSGSPYDVGVPTEP